jgi:hypothetical protein
MSEEKEPKVKVVDREKEPLKNSKMKIVIELERTFDPNRKRNDLMMTMGAAGFTDPETDEEVGEVLHGVPAHSVIRDKRTKEDWLLNYADLFTAYMRARQEFEKEDVDDTEDNK